MRFIVLATDLTWPKQDVFNKPRGLKGRKWEKEVRYIHSYGQLKGIFVSTTQ